MFSFFRKNNAPVLQDFIGKAGLSREEAAKMLRTSPELLAEFEKTYARHETKRNMPGIRPETVEKQMRGDAGTSADIRDRIVKTLLPQTEVICFDGRDFTLERFQVPADLAPVEPEEADALPAPVRPFLTGTAVRRDMGNAPSYLALLSLWKKYLETEDPVLKQQFYGCFRQGLDILDLDQVLYAMLDGNENSMGYWFMPIAEAALEEGFFRIPETRIAKVPIDLLQLARLDYMSLNRETLAVVDEWAKQAFALEPDGDYFVKTGIRSDKFDFRNARVRGKEINDLGQYLLYIHAKATAFAHFDLSGKDRTVHYGGSTTNEWCVRKFIPSATDARIYHGLPLRPEYRIFVDFDARQVIGKSPYWEPETMKRRFEQMDDAKDPDMVHDSLAYRMAEPWLMESYARNVNRVCAHLEKLLPAAAGYGLTGQWSVDVMQEGDDFYLIDMATAETSAFYECVPKALRRPRTEERWLPNLSCLKA